MTVMDYGESIAEIARSTHARRQFRTRDEVTALLDRQIVDPEFAHDLAWISAGTTDDLGPPR